jgi:hypothetical protein
VLAAPNQGEFAGDLLAGSRGAGRSSGRAGRSTGPGRGSGADRGRPQGMWWPRAAATEAAGRVGWPLRLPASHQEVAWARTPGCCGAATTYNDVGSAWSARSFAGARTRDERGLWAPELGTKGRHGWTDPPAMGFETCVRGRASLGERAATRRRKEKGEEKAYLRRW